MTQTPGLRWSATRYDERGPTMRQASLAIGRNPACVHRFVELAEPRMLAAGDAKRPAKVLG